MYIKINIEYSSLVTVNLIPFIVSTQQGITIFLPTQLQATCSKVTFEMRRHDIVNNTKHLTQIMEDYPFLKCPDEVSQVFNFRPLAITICQHTSLHSILSITIILYFSV